MKYPYIVLSDGKCIAKFREAHLAEMFAIMYSDRYPAKMVDIRWYYERAFRNQGSYQRGIKK